MWGLLELLWQAGKDQATMLMVKLRRLSERAMTPDPQLCRMLLRCWTRRRSRIWRLWVISGVNEAQMQKLLVFIVMLALLMTGCSGQKRCCPPGVDVYNEDIGCYSVNCDGSCPSGWNEWFD